MQNSAPEFPFALRFGSRKVWTVLGLLFLCLGTAFVAKRTYSNYSPVSDEFDWTRRGLSDFHSLLGYSSAYRDGVNPYSLEVMDHVVVTRPAAPFSPLQFMLHMPFTYLDLHAGELAFSIVHWMLLGLLAYLCVRMGRMEFDLALWLWIFGFIVFSRPGHIGIFTGYLTVQLAVGSLLAVHYAKSKPWLAGVGILLASGKPTYLIPLVILLAYRRDIKALIIGCVMTVVVAMAGLGYLASFSSMGDVVAGIQAGQEAFHEDSTEDPVNTWTRIDVLGMFAKAINWKPDDKVYLAGMLGLLILPGWAVFKARQREVAQLWPNKSRNEEDEIKEPIVGERSWTDEGAAGLSGVIVVLAMLVSLYHHSYDCMTAFVAAAGLALNGERLCPAIGKFWRYLIAMLLAVPAVNYASTQSFRDALSIDQYSAVWQSLTMLNGICLLLSLLIAMWFAFRPTRSKS